MFELYDKKTDKMEQRRRTESDLIVYASQRDPNQVAEYRNIREVDGKPVRNQIERVEKLFERVAKADSTGKELDRINRESVRYDLDTQFTGYTIFNAFAIWSKLRRYFKYEFALMLEKAGFRDVFPFGDYTDEEVSETHGDMTFRAVK